MHERELFNPLLEPTWHQTAEEYRSQQMTTVTHFFEKLLLLKERMNIPTTKKMANERHQYMVEFLDKFLQESYHEESIYYKMLSKYKSLK
jgi:uncharacterized protein